MNPFVPGTGSSRPAALLRIGLVFLLWAELGLMMLPWRSLQPERLFLAACFWISTPLLLAGFRTTFSAAFTAATLLLMFVGYGLYGSEPDFVHHHTWVLVCSAILLVLTPSGRSYSVDRWLALRRGTAGPEQGWTGGMQLIGLLLSAIYFWSAWDKTSWAFLSGQRLQAIFLHLYLENVPIGDLVTWGVGAIAVGTVAFEYLLSFGIHVRRWHWWLLPAGMLLHALFYVLLPVGVFSANMVLLYLALLDPDEVHRFLDRMQAPAPEAPVGTT